MVQPPTQIGQSKDFDIGNIQQEAEEEKKQDDGDS
jgi:hypothetical protein